MAEKSFESNVKMMITSLLTSTPLNCTIRQLRLDYKNMIGEEIPHRKLGYSSLEEFMLSIPDTVNVRGQGPMAIVTPVVNEKTAHMNELVMKQKSAKKRKFPPPRKRSWQPVWQPSQISQAPRGVTQKIIYPKPQAVRNVETKAEAINDQEEKHVVKENKHLIPRNVIFAQPFIPQQTVNTTPAYHSNMNQMPQQTWGQSYNQIESKNIQDTTPAYHSNVNQMHRHAWGQSYNQVESKNIQDTTPAYISDVNQMPLQTWGQSYNQVESKGIQDDSKFTQLSPSSRSFFEMFHPPNNDYNNIVTNQESGSYSVGSSFSDILKSNERKKDNMNNDSKDKTNPDVFSNTLVSKGHLNSLLSNSSPLSDSSNDFASEFNNNSYSDVTIPKRKEWRYLSDILSDVVKNKDSQTKVNVSYVKEDYNSNFSQGRKSSPTKNVQSRRKRSISNSFEKEDVTIQIPRDVQNNLKTLIAQYPEGLWCSQLPNEYYKAFKKTLNYETYKYKSLIAMCMDLPEIFHYVRPSKEDFKLYDRSRPLPKEAEKTFTMASYSVKSPGHIIEKPLPDLQSVLFADYLPSDIMINELVPRQFVDDVKEGDYIEINVAEIFDLSKFWIYLRANGLDELMDEMQVFYNEHREKYLIPIAFVKEGLYCVAKFYGEYHRGIIVKVFENRSHVTIFFSDYGTVCKIPRNKLCFLVKRFGKLPFQSIRSRLANIYPIYENMTWSQGDIKIFYDLVSNKDLVAQVNKILHDKQILDLYLIERDTNECINDILVKEKIALYTNQERPKTMVNLGYKPVVKYLHLFPSFPDIEFGVVSSVAEFTDLTNQGITYEYIYPEYFYRTKCDTNLAEIEEEHDLAIERAKEKYKKDSLFPNLTSHNIREIQDSQRLDWSIFGSIEDEIKAFLKGKKKDLDYTENVDHFGMRSKKYTKKVHKHKRNTKEASENVIKSEKGIQVENSDYFDDDYCKTQKKFVQDLNDDLKSRDEAISCNFDDECQSFYESTITTDIDDENIATDVESNASFATQISRGSQKVDDRNGGKSDLNLDSLLVSLEDDVCNQNEVREDVENLSVKSMLISFSDDSATQNNVEEIPEEEKNASPGNRSKASSCEMISSEESSKHPNKIEEKMSYVDKKQDHIEGSTNLNEKEDINKGNTTQMCTDYGDNQSIGVVNEKCNEHAEKSADKNDFSQQNETMSSWQAPATWEGSNSEKTAPNVECNSVRNSPEIVNSNNFKAGAQVPHFAPPNVNNHYIPRQPPEAAVYFPWSDANSEQQNLSAPPGFTQLNPQSRAIPPPPGFYPRSAHPRPPGIAPPVLIHPAISWLQQPQPIYVFNNPTFFVQDSSPDFFSIYNNNLMSHLTRALPSQGQMQPPQ